MPDRFESKDLWVRGLSLTYQCELRTENTGRAATLYQFNPLYYEQITREIAEDSPLLSSLGQQYANQSGKLARMLSPVSWWLRRVQGKILSSLRLLKAAFTFNQPLEYLLWKIERHSGIHVEPSPRQLKHPLIFAWPLLWKLHRKGAFR